MYAEFCHGNGELALTEEQNFLTSATILAQDLALMLCHYFHCNCSVNFRVFFMLHLKQVRKRLYDFWNETHDFKLKNASKCFMLLPA